MARNRLARIERQINNGSASPKDRARYGYLVKPFAATLSFTGLLISSTTSVEAGNPTPTPKVSISFEWSRTGSLSPDEQVQAGIDAKLLGIVMTPNDSYLTRIINHALLRSSNGSKDAAAHCPDAAADLVSQLLQMTADEVVNGWSLYKMPTMGKGAIPLTEPTYFLIGKGQNDGIIGIFNPLRSDKYKVGTVLNLPKGGRPFTLPPNAEQISGTGTNKALSEVQSRFADTKDDKPCNPPTGGNKVGAEVPVTVNSPVSLETGTSASVARDISPNVLLPQIKDAGISFTATGLLILALAFWTSLHARRA